MLDHSRLDCIHNIPCVIGLQELHVCAHIIDGKVSNGHSNAGLLKNVYMAIALDSHGWNVRNKNEHWEGTKSIVNAYIRAQGLLTVTSRSIIQASEKSKGWQISNLHH